MNKFEDYLMEWSDPVFEMGEIKPVELNTPSAKHGIVAKYWFHAKGVDLTYFRNVESSIKKNISPDLKVDAAIWSIPTGGVDVTIWFRESRNPHPA